VCSVVVAAAVTVRCCRAVCRALFALPAACCSPSAMMMMGTDVAAAAADDHQWVSDFAKSLYDLTYLVYKQYISKTKSLYTSALYTAYIPSI
jgi:hypothetical protein